MYYELNKREKKIARQLIDKGLGIAYTNALEMSASLITKWQAGELTNKEAYLTLYRELDKHDNKIARRYNDLSGSKWLACIADLFAENIINEEDIKDFADETKKVLYAWSGKGNK